MSWLHVFDLDGTLLRESTASLEIAGVLGSRAALLEMEDRFALGRATTQMFAAELLALWDLLDDDAVEQAFVNAPWIEGIARVLADITARGEHTMLVTMSPMFFADRARRFGFEHVVASQFPELPFREPLNPSHILEPQDKVAAVRARLRELDLDVCRVTACGDSMSDEPLFAQLRHTVAVNATPALASLAECTYVGTNLWAAYCTARAAMARRS